MKITFLCLNVFSYISMDRVFTSYRIYIFCNIYKYLIRSCVSKTLAADWVTVH